MPQGLGKNKSNVGKGTKRSQSRKGKATKKRKNAPSNKVCRKLQKVPKLLRESERKLTVSINQNIEDVMAAKLQKDGAKLYLVKPKNSDVGDIKPRFGLGKEKKSHGKASKLAKALKAAEKSITEKKKST